MIRSVLICALVAFFATCKAAPRLCADGSYPVQCFVRPCAGARCPAFPDAQCQDDYCGGCNARFYVNGSEVTDKCAGSVATYDEPQTCTDGSRPVQCFVEPCRIAKCAAYPVAQCHNDFCGGCNARFFANGQEVTQQCDSYSSNNRRLCADGSYPLQCFVQPCSVQKCAAFPDARCEDDYCGGCNARFYANDTEVTSLCDSKESASERQSRCSDGSFPVQCKVEPCRVNTCVAFPDAVCENDYCGGCHALFYVNGSDVTEQCDATVLNEEEETSLCSDGSHPFQCFVQPCKVAECPAYPNAQCQDDYCGGCNARFYDNYREITADCRRY